MEKVVWDTPHQASRWQRNKALILWGFITNIPDLDIFIGRYIPHKDYMSEFLFHRGLSHSVFFNVFVALLVWFICAKTDHYKRPVWRWVLGSYLSILLGHLLVDAMTSYGGRYLLPFSSFTYSFDNIFVIDLFYTLPLIALWFVYIFIKKTSFRKIRYRIGAIRILIYPAFTFFSKNIATHAFQSSLSTQQISYTRMMTAPEPLQAFLWRAVVQSSWWYYEAYYSLFDDLTKKSHISTDTWIAWYYIPNNTLVRDALPNAFDLQRVEQWAQWRTSYTPAGNGNVLINAVKQWGILGRQKTGNGLNSSMAFIVNANGEVIWQWGRGRFLERPFAQVWKEHWERVFSITNE